MNLTNSLAVVDERELILDDDLILIPTFPINRTNFIFGTPFDDILTDFFFSTDFILASFGNDVITLVNDGISDTALGQDGDDTFLVSDRRGSNLIDGGTELKYDQVDYSSLNESITLKARGEVEKASGGVDLLVDIESIVGDVGFGIVNTIDGSDAGSGSLIVDLEDNSLEVIGTGSPVPLSFKVINFDNVRGTDNNDVIVGNRNDNVFFGSKGNDTYDGGLNSFDTIDYSDLGQRITLNSQGVIDKGSAGVDQLLGNPTPFTPSLNKIVGATGQRNLIDGRVAGITPTTFDIDLQEESLSVSGIGNFEVVNFLDVIGTANSDTIEGNDTRGTSNLLFGQQGNDFLRGVNESSNTPGLKEFDILVGGSGFDTFALGDFFVQDYYLSDSTLRDPFGNDDFAYILDFTRGQDQVSLSFTNPYVFNFYGFGLDIYADVGSLSSRVDSQDDLISRVIFNASLDLRVPAPSVGDELIAVDPNISQEIEPKFTNPDEVLDFAVDSNSLISQSTISGSFDSSLSNIFGSFDSSLLDSSETFGSSFSFDTIPDELNNLFAPTGSIV